MTNLSWFSQMLAAILCVFLTKCISVMGDLDYDSKLSLKLEHSFDLSDQPVFTHRGDIVVKSLSASSTYSEQRKLSPHEATALKTLARGDGHYRLRATVTTTDGRTTSFITFVKACALVESHLSDVVSINLDHMGNVVAVTLSTTAPCTGEDTADSMLTHFNTEVYVRPMDVGPVPDTASYIQKLDREREAKERGETKDNRSFLSKYWMYIVPVVIFVLVSSATNPEGGGQR